MGIRWVVSTILVCGVACTGARVFAQDPPAMEFVRVADDGRGFVLADSGRPFHPWGFNYDHDPEGRLLEDYWVDEWDRVETHLGRIADTGATVVRIHLQFGRFMESPDRPDRDALDRLVRLVAFCERRGLRIDLTGLGCYHAADVPPWYDALDESERWKSQACFWREIARRVADSPAIFCYDLMNEPVVPGGRRDDRQWLGPPFAGKCFVQFITLDSAGRAGPEVARQWIATLVDAIREVDSRHPITVGLVPWSLDRPGLTSGFVPQQVAERLDFVAVHVYPETGEVDAALETLRGFDVGKPILVEEIFPLKGSMEEVLETIDRAPPGVAGWISFHWGASADELKASGELGDAIVAAWIRRFVDHMRQRYPD